MRCLCRGMHSWIHPHSWNSSHTTRTSILRTLGLCICRVHTSHSTLLPSNWIYQKTTRENLGRLLLRIVYPSSAIPPKIELEDHHQDQGEPTPYLLVHTMTMPQWEHSVASVWWLSRCRIYQQLSHSNAGRGPHEREKSRLRVVKLPPVGSLQ